MTTLPETKIPKTMTAIEIVEPGGPEVLKPCTRPTPVPNDGEVLIRVEAAGVNRPDIIQRKGLYPLPPGASDLPGLEVAGTVVIVGNDVTDWAIGDKVCALTHGGGYAEYVSVASQTVLPLPKGLSMAEAATLPETFFTVWANVFNLGELRKGERFLVHGGTSGIGYTSIQLAKAFGAEVYTTAGSEEKCNFCRNLGADLVINYKEKDFEEAIMEYTKDLAGEPGVDVILDMVAGSYVQKNLNILRQLGRMVFIAFLGGPKTEINIVPILRKRITITGSLLRPQSLDYKQAIRDALLKNVWPLLENKKITPIIDSQFPLKEASKAHAHMETSAHMGKIVLLRG